MSEALIRYRAKEHKRAIEQLKEGVQFFLVAMGLGGICYIALFLIFTLI